MPAGEARFWQRPSAAADQLLLQASPHGRRRINRMSTSLVQERPNLSRIQQYLMVRASLLLEQPHRYSVVTYLDQLVNLQAGERKALPL